MHRVLLWKACASRQRRMHTRLGLVDCRHSYSCCFISRLRCGSLLAFILPQQAEQHSRAASSLFTRVARVTCVAASEWAANFFPVSYAAIQTRRFDSYNIEYCNRLDEHIFRLFAAWAHVRPTLIRASSMPTRFRHVGPC